MLLKNTDFFFNHVDRENSLDQRHRVMVFKNICKNYFLIYKTIYLRLKTET